VRRAAVVGNSGAGKSMLAARLARRLGVTHVELDAIFHLAGWRELQEDDFRSEVMGATATGGWVVDGNYIAVRDLVWSHADTVVWLDLPRRLVMHRITWRTVSRTVMRRPLWNGNRERLRNLLPTDPERSIILWSWVRHAEYRERYAAAMVDPRWSRLRFVRITSTRAVEQFLETAA
jgi:adenylate kinase family enzyme